MRGWDEASTPDGEDGIALGSFEEVLVAGEPDWVE